MCGGGGVGGGVGGVSRRCGRISRRCGCVEEKLVLHSAILSHLEININSFSSPDYIVRFSTMMLKAVIVLLPSLFLPSRSKVQYTVWGGRKGGREQAVHCVLAHVHMHTHIHIHPFAKFHV